MISANNNSNYWNYWNYSNSTNYYPFNQPIEGLSWPLAVTHIAFVVKFTHTHKTFLGWKVNPRAYFKNMLVRDDERQRVDTESYVLHFNGNLFTA